MRISVRTIDPSRIGKSLVHVDLKFKICNICECNESVDQLHVIYLLLRFLNFTGRATNLKKLRANLNPLQYTCNV